MGEGIHETKVHKYLTGSSGSMISIEALDKNTANEPTFDKSVVWVSLDCLSPAKIDGCDDDGVVGERSLVQLGYVPPQTTLYIAIADNGDMATGAGEYSLKVTEQPVKLFLSTTFAGGLSPFTASDSGSDSFTWAQCELNCPGSPSNYTFSRSAGPYALAADDPGNHDLLNETLRTGPVGVGNASNVFFQFNVNFKQSNGALTWDDSGDGATWKDLDTETLFDAAGRRIKDVSADVMSSSIHVGFTYDDKGLDTKFAQVDDVFVYGF